MGRSDVTFRNSTGAKIYVAYMRLDYGCQCGDPWDVRGWISLDPGEIESRQNPTKNRWFYYYAESETGATWTGPFPAEVMQAKFDKCKCIGVIIQNGAATNPYHTVGFRELDTNTHSGVNFI